MGWFVAILSTLMLVLIGGVAVLLVWAHRILEGVNAICVYLDNTEDQLEADEQDEQPLVSPDQVPLSRHLHDLIAQPPHDASVGEFQGRQPWISPLPPDDQNT